MVHEKGLVGQEKRNMMQEMLTFNRCNGSWDPACWRWSLQQTKLEQDRLNFGPDWKAPQMISHEWQSWLENQISLGVTYLEFWGFIESDSFSEKCNFVSGQFSIDFLKWETEGITKGCYWICLNRCYVATSEIPFLFLIYSYEIFNFKRACCQGRKIPRLKIVIAIQTQMMLEGFKVSV